MKAIRLSSSSAISIRIVTNRKHWQENRGNSIAIVRKAKGNYFLGAATNEKPRTLEIKLDFLELGKQYKAVIYADGENADWKSNPTDYRITEQTVTSENTLNIRMAAGGGQAISFMAL